MNSDLTFDVFTTRADTLFGATYCVLAPEHNLVNQITTKQQAEAVKLYKEECAKKSDLERTELATEKTGIWTGAYAINPVNNQEIPIYISDYVLVSYGTGAVMAVPAHDQRDWEFANKFNLPIKRVVEGGDLSKSAYVDDGKHINSEFLNGLNKEEAINKMIEWLEKKAIGKGTIKYRFREWIFGRQRYWGEPIPVVHMEDGTTKLLDEKNLPLVLPELEDYKPHNGQSPLEKADAWKNIVIDGKKGKRETTTMPSSAASSWYFLRYVDPKNNNSIGDPKLLEHWLPVDLYVGGAEHAVGHLLYSRFWNKFLYDKGFAKTEEPFKKLEHVGMVLGSNNEKMSKSKGNVVNPDDIISSYGADVLRLYEMFMGPFQESKPWNESGVDGAKRFLDRVWRIFIEEKRVTDKTNSNIEKIYHQTVKKVTNDYEKLTYNTAISQMMIFINSIANEQEIPREYAEGFVKMLNPIAPFITEEMWALLGHNETITYAEWPTYDEEKTQENDYDLVVQINGKLRDKFLIPMGTNLKEMEKIALELPKIKEFLAGKEVVKIIPIKDRLVNIVIKI